MYFVITIGEGENRVVFGKYGNRSTALAVLRLVKKGRMFVFPTLADRNRFVTDPSSYLQYCDGPPTPVAVAAKGVPTSETQAHFRRLLYAGDYEEVTALIDKYPALLINRLNLPRKYGSGNALQIAAANGFTQICQKILSAVESPAYIEQFEGGKTNMTYEIGAQLVETYLNTPNNDTYETPLHFAVKFGHLDVAKLLMSYPQCEMKPNIDGLYPADMVCRNAKPANKTKFIMNGIAAMLKENYFVPLIRTEGNVEQPYIGEPFSRQNVPDLSPIPNDKFKYKRQIAALAGPMSQSKAQTFYQRWKKAARMTVSKPVLHEAKGGKSS